MCSLWNIVKLISLTYFDILLPRMATWRSGNAGVCKTSTSRFDPGRGLQKIETSQLVSILKTIIAL